MAVWLHLNHSHLNYSLFQGGGGGGVVVGGLSAVISAVL